MATEFDIIFDEFSAELDALGEMTGSSGGSGITELTPRARIAAGNGAVLLLAAIFEEHVRQQVRAAFREKTRNITDITEFPAKIAAVVWKRSMEALARTPFEVIESNVRSTDEVVSATLAFCLRKETTADVSKPLSHNENNMRAGELNRLFNQIGLKSIIAEACKQESLIAFLGCDSPGKANAEIEAKFEDFFRRRNDIAHAIQFGSSSGPSELRQDIEMFRIFARALATTLVDLLIPVVPPARRQAGRRSRANPAG